MELLSLCFMHCNHSHSSPPAILGINKPNIPASRSIPGVAQPSSTLYRRILWLWLLPLWIHTSQLAVPILLYIKVHAVGVRVQLTIALRWHLDGIASNPIWLVVPHSDSSHFSLGLNLDLAQRMESGDEFGDLDRNG